MELFRITPNIDVLDAAKSKLYLRTRRGSVIVKDMQYIISKEGCISTDTYFNIFSSTKYAQYTKVTDVELHTTVSGDLCVKLCMCRADEEQIVDEYHVHSDVATDVCFKFNISDLPKNETICHYLIYESNSQSIVYDFGAYSADISQNDVFLVIVICTYKRKNLIVNTLAKLSQMKISENDISIIVVDNGQDTWEQYAHVTILTNRNLGGSGGFTKGMLAAKDMGATHILLMDDDCNFDVSVITKTLNVLKSLSPTYAEAFILGGLLDLKNPQKQYEAGARFDGLIKRCKADLDLSNLKSLIANEQLESVDYGGWWYCCIPTTVIQQELPLPLFIRLDDLEYGLRSMRQFITMNGIGVWHHTFEKEDNSPFGLYYHERNLAIIRSLYHLSWKDFCVHYWIKTVQLIRSRDYRRLHYFQRAYHDYLLGTKLFLVNDIEELNNDLMFSAQKDILHCSLSNNLSLFLYSLFLFIKTLLLRQTIGKDFMKNLKLISDETYWLRILEKGGVKCHQKF